MGKADAPGHSSKAHYASTPRRVPRPRLILTYSAPGGRGRASESFALGCRRRAGAPPYPAVARVCGCVELVASLFGSLRHDEARLAGQVCAEFARVAARTRAPSRVLVATPSRVRLVAPAGRALAVGEARRPAAKPTKAARYKAKETAPRHWCSSMALGDWDAAAKARALYVANWEGDAILEYAVGLDNSVAFRRVFAADARLKHPEGMVFWRGRLRVCASYHSAVLALKPDGTVDPARTVRLRATDWCWGLAVDPATDRLLVSASPPYDFQADLPGDNPHVARRGELLEVDERPRAGGWAHAVRAAVSGLTRPGGLAVAPPGHPRAGAVFVTEYGVAGAPGRVLECRRGENGALVASVYVDFAAVPRGRHDATPPDLVNPWTLAFAPAGDALYVATDPNHRTVHEFDSAGVLVRASRAADEAPNFLLCA